MYALKLLINTINPIWNEGGGAKMPPPSFSFLNIFKMKKGMTLPFYDFYLLFILKLSAKFLAKLLIGSRVIVILSKGYRKIQKQKKIFSIFFSIFFFFFETTFFAKYFKYTLCRSGTYDFFHLK